MEQFPAMSLHRANPKPLIFMTQSHPQPSEIWEKTFQMSQAVMLFWFSVLPAHDTHPFNQTLPLVCTVSMESFLHLFETPESASKFPGDLNNALLGMIVRWQHGLVVVRRSSSEDVFSFLPCCWGTWNQSLHLSIPAHPSHTASSGFVVCFLGFNW